MKRVLPLDLFETPSPRRTCRHRRNTKGGPVTRRLAVVLRGAGLGSTLETDHHRSIADEFAAWPWWAWLVIGIVVGIVIREILYCIALWSSLPQ